MSAADRNAVCLEETIVSHLTRFVKGKSLDTNKDPAEQPIPSAMAALRRFLGIRQSDISKALGVDRSSVAQWERGFHKPPPAVLLKLSEIAPEGERQWWRDQASERAGIDLKEINTPGANAEPGAVRQIKLLKRGRGAEALKAMAAGDVERELELPAEWFPEGGLLRAAYLSGAVSPRMVAIIDASRDQVEQLVGRMVAVEVPGGIEVCWLLLEEGVYTLQSFQPRQLPRVLPRRDKKSIVGLVRWVGEAPATPVRRKAGT
jgi:transcriptional regulator with XRE-family HTH domain